MEAHILCAHLLFLNLSPMQEPEHKSQKGSDFKMDALQLLFATLCTDIWIDPSIRRRNSREAAQDWITKCSNPQIMTSNKMTLNEKVSFRTGKKKTRSCLVFVFLVVNGDGPGLALAIWSRIRSPKFNSPSTWVSLL